MNSRGSEFVHKLRTVARASAVGFRAGQADGKLELIAQNLGSDYEEFTPLNRFETRVLLRGGLQFY